MSKKNKLLISLLISNFFIIPSSIIGLTIKKEIKSEKIDKFLINNEKNTAKIQSVVPDKFVYDAFSTKLQIFSAKDYISDYSLKMLLIEEFVQFSNGKYVENPIYIFNGIKEEFVNKLTSIDVKEIEKDSTSGKLNFGTQISFLLKIDNIKTSEIIIKNIKPYLKFDYNENFSIKSTDFAYFTAEEFAYNFNENILNLINHNESVDNLQKWLINTNFQEKSFIENLNPVISMGKVDNINGEIKNNSISIQIPKVNLINSNWEYTDDIFETKLIKFDILNLTKIPLNININKNTNFDISQNSILKNMSANLFNEETFLNELIKYQSLSFNDKYLVTTNYDIATFRDLISNIKISNVNIEKGEIEISFSLKNNLKLRWYKFNLTGFKKIIQINQEKTEINYKNFDFLNDSILIDSVVNNEKGQAFTFIEKNINNFFKEDKTAVFKINREFFKFEYISKLEINDFFVYKNLRQIRLKIKLNKKAAQNNNSTFYLNNKELISNNLYLTIKNFQTISFEININSDSISNKSAFDGLNDTTQFYDSFVTFSDSTSAAKYELIKTTLTKEEFQLISNIEFIEKNTPYLSTLVKIKYTDKSNKNQIKYFKIHNSDTNVDYNFKNTLINATNFSYLKNVYVDNFSKNDVINMFGFNKKDNEYNLLTLDSSQEFFKEVLLKNIDILRHSNSVQVELDLYTCLGKDKIKRFTFYVTNLKPKLQNFSFTLLLSLISITVGSVFISILFLIYRQIKKRRILKINNWNEIKGSKN